MDSHDNISAHIEIFLMIQDDRRLSGHCVLSQELVLARSLVAHLSSEIRVEKGKATRKLIGEMEQNSRDRST
jgi:hypothetical protein